MKHRIFARRRGALGALAGALLLAACATPSIFVPETAPAPSDETQAGGRLKPMPIRPLNVQADCRFKDEAGYGASALLDVSYSEVHRFSASVSVPKRGSCHFDLADFEQVRKEPHVELRARDGCVVRMWEQGDQVTVAFAQCASRCDRGTFDYVWPILVDRPSGRCN
ncbi:hypothetical protein J5J83_14620 [Azoarcus sp. L1K30]|uniref:hypothetical protein n=1 Tax=Azoarcus sp. L1K30 TaxID=2820277 RepID=UPI001B820E88|nr:hypothetical protein [Azoarcus sp. L1K30]MBR0567354.1 hypothetical protein [Azoarcus sp. L1K30]